MVSVKSVKRHIVFRTYIAQKLEIMIVLCFLAFTVNVVGITYNGAFNFSSLRVYFHPEISGKDK